MEGTIRKLRDYVLSVYIPICLCISLVIVGSFYSVYKTSKQNEFTQDIDRSVKNIKNDLESSRDTLLNKYLAIMDENITEEETDEIFINRINLVQEDLQMLTTYAKNEGIYEQMQNGKSLSFYIDDIKNILSTYSSKKDFTTNREYFNYLNSLYSKMQTDVIEIENIISQYNNISNNSLKTKLILGWLVIILFLILVIIHFARKSMRFETFLSKNLEQASNNAIKIIEDKAEEVSFFTPEKEEKEFDIDNDEFKNIKEAIIKTSKRVSDVKDLTKEKVSKIKNEEVDFVEEKLLLNDIKNLSKNSDNIKYDDKNVTDMIFEDFNDFNISLKKTETDTFNKNIQNVLENLKAEEKSENTIPDSFEEIKKIVNKLSFLSLTAVNEARQAGSNGLEFEIVANDINKETKLLFDAIENMKIEEKEYNIDISPLKTLIEDFEKEIAENDKTNEEEIEKYLSKIKDSAQNISKTREILIDKIKENERINAQIVEMNVKLNENADEINEKVSSLTTKIDEKEQLLQKRKEKNSKIIKDILSL